MNRCSECDQDVRDAEVVEHIEAYHVGPRPSDSLYYITCGSCAYRVSDERALLMMQHCVRTKHLPDKVSLNWAIYMELESSRIRELISSGCKLLCKGSFISPADKKAIEFTTEDKETCQVTQNEADSSNDCDNVIEESVCMVEKSHVNRSSASKNNDPPTEKTTIDESPSSNIVSNGKKSEEGTKPNVKLAEGLRIFESPEKEVQYSEVPSQVSEGEMFLGLAAVRVEQDGNQTALPEGEAADLDRSQTSQVESQNDSKEHEEIFIADSDDEDGSENENPPVPCGPFDSSADESAAPDELSTDNLDTATVSVPGDSSALQSGPDEEREEEEAKESAPSSPVSSVDPEEPVANDTTEVENGTPESEPEEPTAPGTRSYGLDEYLSKKPPLASENLPKVDPSKSNFEKTSKKWSKRRFIKIARKKNGTEKVFEKIPLAEDSSEHTNPGNTHHDGLDHVARTLKAKRLKMSQMSPKEPKRALLLAESQLTEVLPKTAQEGREEVVTPPLLPNRENLLLKSNRRKRSSNGSIRSKLTRSNIKMTCKICDKYDLECGSLFEFRERGVRHVLTHAKINFFECTECSFQSAWNSSVRRHLKAKRCKGTEVTNLRTDEKIEELCVVLRSAYPSIAWGDEMIGKSFGGIYF